MQICCVRNLSKMFAIGTLDLSNNDLSWNELLRLRHVFILDLRLYGNELLENVCNVFFISKAYIKYIQQFNNCSKFNSLLNY